MFGMLDYRAHKLYLILFGIPIFLLSMFNVFGIPFINYLIGVVSADERIWQIVVSLIALFFVELIWTYFIFIFIHNLFEFIFGLFVDVIPSDGRTKEEAQLVVYGGEHAIRVLQLGQDPKEWTDEFIEDFPTHDFFTNRFYKNEVIERCYAIRDYFLDNPKKRHKYLWENNRFLGGGLNDLEIDKFLEENSLKMDWKEQIITNKVYRRFVVEYVWFVLLLIFHPLG